MISRRTTSSIGKILGDMFTGYTYPHEAIVLHGKLYDFLYEHEYPIWLCNKARHLEHDSRAVKEFVMELLTGEALYDIAFDSEVDVDELIQHILEHLASDILFNYHNSFDYEFNFDDITNLTRNLELDGYVYQDGRLLISESEVLDTDEETGTLETLYDSLGLDNKRITMHCLKLSETDFIDGKWANSISNSRKFLECTLREVANKYSIYIREIPLAKKKYEKNSAVLKYLEDEGLLEDKEKKAISSVYHLLSDTGSHPYMAVDDQARLLRNLALTFSQFIMLRLQGKLK